MLIPLPGIEAVLADEACARVELRRDGEVRAAYVRLGEDAWASADAASDPVHADDLRKLLLGALGEDCDAIVCDLPGEQVAYELQGRTVRVTREPVAPGDEADQGAALTEVADALGIPRSRRKAKFAQAVQFARIVGAALPEASAGPLRILDLACGRSYLGFVLVRLLTASGRRVVLHGVDSEPRLVDRCRRIAGTLSWEHATFETADLGGYSVEPGAHDLAVALHACDTLTDEAVRVAVEGEVPLLFAAPCCQHEVRHQFDSHPLDWVGRYGLLEQRLADTLTDSFRCLVLEAVGYRVKVLRFTAPDVTPKNLLIQAVRTGRPRPERAAEAQEFMRQFGVKPRLARLL